MNTTTLPNPTRRTRSRLRLIDPSKDAKPDRSWTIRKPLGCGAEVRVFVVLSTPEEWDRLPESRDPMWLPLTDGENVIGVMVDGW